MYRFVLVPEPELYSGEPASWAHSDESGIEWEMKKAQNVILTSICIVLMQKDSKWMDLLTVFCEIFGKLGD